MTLVQRILTRGELLGTGVRVGLLDVGGVRQGLGAAQKLANVVDDGVTGGGHLLGNVDEMWTAAGARRTARGIFIMRK